MKAISLFSGAGGMDLGVYSAGFSILAEVEIDVHCCNSLRFNAEKMGSPQVVESDIRKVDPNKLMDSVNIREGQLDLLFGGPPCQSFSLAGKQKGLEDERGMLLFQMVRFADAVKPKVILIEQVKGLLSSKNEKGEKGGVFRTFVRALEEIGYVVKWQTLLAADFGVPQLRERLFVIATKSKNGFRYPLPTHTSPSKNVGLFKADEHVGVGKVLSGLGKPYPKIPRQTNYDTIGNHVDVTPERDRERIAQVPEGSYLAAQSHLGEDLVRGLTKKDTTKYLRLDRARPSNTLRCGEIFFHPTDDRYLTPKEYMRIHSYPDDYVLKGPIRSRTGSVKNLDQHRQIANSVPPKVAEALGGAIREYLNE